jgi:hypothetical protein
VSFWAKLGQHVILPVIVTIIAAGAVAVIAHLWSSNTSVLSAQINFIDLPYSSAPVRYEDKKAVDGAINKLSAPIISGFYNQGNVRSSLRAIRIDLENSSNRRSGVVEISTPGALFWHLGGGSDGTDVSSTILHLDAVDPRTTLIVFGLSSDSWILPGDVGQPKITILESGQTVDVRSRRVDDYYDFMGFGAILRTYPFVSSMTILYGSMLAVVMGFRAAYQSIGRQRSPPLAPSQGDSREA